MAKRYLFIFLAGTFFAVLAYFIHERATPIAESNSDPLVAEKPPAIVPPPMEMLGHAARMPTEQELEDEQRFIEQQVAQVNQWFNSPQVEKRIAAAEQLSVYRVLESEQILAHTLISDFSPEVRRTAAQSLTAFTQPTEQTLAALLSALEDDDEKVQMYALNTLMGMVGNMVRDSTVRKKVLARLDQQSHSKRSSALLKASIDSFLTSQQPLPNIFVNDKN